MNLGEIPTEEDIQEVILNFESIVCTKCQHRKINQIRGNLHTSIGGHTVGLKGVF